MSGDKRTYKLEISEDLAELDELTKKLKPELTYQALKTM